MKLACFVPSIQARWLHRIAYLEDKIIQRIALASNIEEEFQNLWVAASEE